VPELENAVDSIGSPFDSGPAVADGRQPKERRIRSTVAATVHEEGWDAQPDLFPEANNAPKPNVQSPSQRSDGDCVLRLSTPLGFVIIMDETHAVSPHRQSPLPDPRLCKLMPMGNCRSATESEPTISVP
jgi:hypothetical protein